MELAVDIRVAYPAFELAVTQRFGLQGITALFGPSGCGKSTLLRTIAGLEQTATGRIAFGDDVWLDSARRIVVPPHRRGVGYVFQDARLFPHLSVAGNLRYAARRSFHADQR
ncbi:MAG: ATP-binding cassette domain-containing protein, partial [Pseudomonadales bacterium]